MSRAPVEMLLRRVKCMSPAIAYCSRQFTHPLKLLIINILAASSSSHIHLLSREMEIAIRCT
eukprot:scaffold160259_cov30-Tisochrysis_lutea.AAC.3